MPRWLQVSLHLGMIGLGAYTAVQTGSPIPLVVTSGIQTALGAVAQIYNTDGTPQAVPFVPPKAQK